MKDYDRLRFTRGSNEAVVEVWSEPEKQELMKVLENPHWFSRNDLIEKTMYNYSWKDYGKEQWITKTGWWTTPEVATTFGHFLEKYPQWSQLALDIGFVTHIDECLKIIEDEKIDPSLSPVKLRSLLKEKLWYKEMYRGMMLNDEEVQYIKQNGVQSFLLSNFHNHIKPEEKQIHFEAKALSSRMRDLLDKHYHLENTWSPFVSITAHKDVAIGLWSHFWHKKDRKVYVCTMKVPVLDILYFTPHGLGKPSIIDQWPWVFDISIDGVTKEYRYDDKDVESFIYWKVDPSEITDISIPDVKETAWNNEIRVLN